MVEVVLKRLSFQTTTQEDGLTVIDTITKNFYDLVLLDISVPFLTSGELCVQIKETIPKDKLGMVFSYTAHVLPADKDRLVLVRFDDLLIKPINVNALKKLQKFNLIA